MEFNILLENGTMYKGCTVLSRRGIARDRRDVKVALKYEKKVTIKNSYFLNKLIKSREVYDVEEVVIKKEEINDESSSS